MISLLPDGNQAANMGVMKLGDVVKEERIRQGLQAKDLAKMAGVTPAVITRLEQGKRLGRVDTVLKITGVLGIDPARVQRMMRADEEEEEEDETQYVDLAGLTRPIVTLLLVMALIVLTSFWMLGIAGKELPEMFSGLTGVVIGYWFAERGQEKRAASPEAPPTQ